MRHYNTAIALRPKPDEPGAGHLAGRLIDLARELAEPRKVIEKTFLEMGEHLGTCAGLLNEISNLHQAMPAELESADFLAAAASLETVREQLGELTASHADEQEQIAQLTAMATSLDTPVAGLRNAVRAIRFVAVNARIAAAGILSDQVDLGAFTIDMVELAQSVESAITTLGQAHRRFAETLSEAHLANAALARRHGATTGTISGRIREHLATIVEHRTSAQARAQEHASLTLQIRSRIGAAIAGLQTGDVTRQRIEHVEQALALLAGRLPDVPGADATFAAVCNLQVSQLDETMADFSQKIGDIIHSLRQLSLDASSVLHSGSEEAEILLSSGGTALHGMVDDLREISSLFRDFRDTRDKTEAAVNHVAEALEAMLDRVRAITDIEHQIHLLSLNTAIQCGKLGAEGHALRVITHDLRELAGQTATAAGTIVTALDGAGDIARALMTARSTGPAEGIAAIEQDANAAIGLFEAVIERLSERATGMAASGPRALHELGAAAESAVERQDFADRWSNARKELAVLASSAVAQDGGQDLDADFLCQLRASYTMEAERRIYDGLFGHIAGENRCEPAQAEAAGELDDILF
ncbi:methyl-accepting chemotaxis protein [Ciceribacter lividus]|uniref:Methyl-accepting chemotaxis protein n=1 Tax=Ciceribacter lividus TaxID=1197950 RepID=A0A6I7HKM5_9HYPH|nr:methyl-accepting chemotaxis protein [Ciceribacter lividus]RCW21046.1 methyl-accepting chemotaxis protein [Ciceribacter lividus]